MSESNKSEYKETHTDSESTIEYEDLKAVTKHPNKDVRKRVENGDYCVDWDISTQGDRICDKYGTTDDVKKEMKHRYEEGKRRLAK